MCYITYGSAEWVILWPSNWLHQTHNHGSVSLQEISVINISCLFLRWASIAFLIVICTSPTIHVTLAILGQVHQLWLAKTNVISSYFYFPNASCNISPDWPRAKWSVEPLVFTKAECVPLKSTSRAGRGKVDPLSEEVADISPESLQLEVRPNTPHLLTARHVDLTTYNRECSNGKETTSKWYLLESWNIGTLCEHIIKFVQAVLLYLSAIILLADSSYETLVDTVVVYKINLICIF